MILPDSTSLGVTWLLIGPWLPLNQFIKICENSSVNIDWNFGALKDKCGRNGHWMRLGFPACWYCFSPAQNCLLKKKKIGIFKLLSYNISTPSHTILEWFISGAFWWFLIFCKYCTIYLAPACIWKGRWVTHKAFVWSICYPLRLMIIFCISFEIFDKEKSHLHITALYFLIYCLSFLFLA